ncbi:hypothetical protein D3C72_594760 [compost metagenome]
MAEKTAMAEASRTTPSCGALPSWAGQKGVATVRPEDTTTRAHRPTVRSSIFFLLAAAVLVAVFMTSSPVVVTSELYQHRVLRQATFTS